MVASGTSDVITATAGLVVALTALVSALLNRLKLRGIHRDTGEINKAVNSKESGAESIQVQVQQILATLGELEKRIK